VGEVKEEERVQQQQGDVEMLNVDQNSMTNKENQEETHSQHSFIH
jgi:hypothetical protein